MNRIFLSLYLTIVLSIIVLGWGADRLWQRYSPDEPQSVLESALIDNVVLVLATLKYAEREKHLDILNQNKQLQFTLMDIASFSSSNMGEKIIAGQRVIIHEDQNQQVIYQRIAESHTVLRINSSEAKQVAAFIYPLFLFLFYAAIALAIYFWVWPLSRDLKILEKTTRNTSTHHLPKKVGLSRRSAVYPLAEAFNRMVERIETLLMTQREMTYAVSHELRTPLARMKFALALFDTSNKRDEHIASVATDIVEMERLITDLLTYASFDADTQALTLSTGDLPELVASLIHSNAAIYPTIECRLENQLGSPLVNCDWVLMERCLHNLIDNASKWAKSTVIVRLSVNDAQVIICVDDDGIGIPEEYRQRVFTSFFRIPNQSHHDAKKSSGFGLGLAIVARIIRWHDGVVEVNESPSGGAQFVVAWPK